MTMSRDGQAEGVEVGHPPTLNSADSDQHLRLQAAVDRVASNWGPLDVSEELIESFRSEPLSPEAIRAIRLIGNVETNSMTQFKNAIAIGALEHPYLHRFVRWWISEEQDHGRVFWKVAAASDNKPTDLDSYYADVQSYRHSQTFAQRHAFEMITAATLFMKNPAAIYAPFGAVQEYSVIRSYNLLKTAVDDERFSEIVDKVIPVEQRHFGVYYTAAQVELTDDEKAQQQARWAMEHLWKPVGYDAMGPENWTWVFNWLCPDDDSAQYLADVDRIVDRIPGLEGLHKMEEVINIARSGLTLEQAGGQQDTSSRLEILRGRVNLLREAAQVADYSHLPGAMAVKGLKRVLTRSM